MDKQYIMIADGNEAAAYAAYAFSEIAAIYPITPSSPMAEKTDQWSAAGRKNLFGQTVTLVEMQSEAGAAGAVHGALEAGSLAATFTSSQGLMLMIPALHRISGTRQPGVLHVASRTVGTHAMSIFGDHSDVMNCRQTGFAQLSSGSVQEAMDLAGIAHLSAIRSRVPFMHFFDGFRTSHEIQKIRAIPYEVYDRLLDREALTRFRQEALNPDHPTLRCTVQNPDVYFQFREANNTAYDNVPAIVEDYMTEINRITGEDYHLFNYYGAEDAERVIVAMGSVSGAARETVEALNLQGEKVGYLQVHLFNPFSEEHMLAAMPKTVRKIAVLDRCKEMGAAGEPLYLAVCAAFANKENRPYLCGGRYGLSSKDTSPAQIKAVFDHLRAEKPAKEFTVGIEDDVTELSIPVDESFRIRHEGTKACKFWGLGSDGTVGANKNSIKIIGSSTDMYAQGYFEYDTKKSFGITKSHLRFGNHPILSTYLVKEADFIACHNQSFLDKYDIVSELKEGGVFLLNSRWTAEEANRNLPDQVKKQLIEKRARFYIVDANGIAEDLGLGNRISMVLQAAFFKLTGILPEEEARAKMKEAARKSFQKKGEAVVQKNQQAIEAGMERVAQVELDDKAGAEAAKADTEHFPAFIKNILMPLNAQKGDMLPVSAVMDYQDGTMPMGTTAYEKRGIASRIPIWDAESCAQCNRCSYVCPHGVIRPYLLDAEEKAAAPEGFVTTGAKGAEGFFFSLQISDMDCTGCGSCAAVCPKKGTALRMEAAPETMGVTPQWEYGLTIKEKACFPKNTVKGSQFRQPLCEFSGACAGCGETPYAKLLTQLYGDRMYWVNATGCTQAWGAAMPSIPYTVNAEGRGPAWSNSLFENNAEFALGMLLSMKQQRKKLRMWIEELGNLEKSLSGAAEYWLETFDDVEASMEASSALKMMLEERALTGRGGELKEQILAHSDQLARKTVWMYGGDGWAYDIGYGGLDHVIAQGEDINVFIVDTEVYSNTGGQSSKATPLGAVAQFQSAGKKTAKKDLGRLLISQGNCYVASVAMGADPNQLIKAIHEAEHFHGPSVIIAYAPCINHGLKLGMDKAQEEMKRAVAAGYWFLYRFNPHKESGKFTLDSKEPSVSYREFLEGEIRYASLYKSFPENAEKLFSQAEKESKEHYAELVRLSGEGR